MKIALLQLNPIVGDIRGNSMKIASALRKAAGADLAVTSELALLGYPPRDLLLNNDFIEHSWESLRHLAADAADLPPVLVGLAEPNPGPVGRPLFNCAALLREVAAILPDEPTVTIPYTTQVYWTRRSP